MSALEWGIAAGAPAGPDGFWLVLLAGVLSIGGLVVVALVAVRVVRLALDGVGPGERAAVLRAAAEVVRAVRSGRRGR
ncbi:hypothetical protein ABZ384_32870 [Streptomyces cyaneofuscatus]|uniref:hypothetical protein n=1 Tax=Streptomyces cyaneofuscatus TaxID=66883 RepID=UPI0033DCF180